MVPHFAEHNQHGRLEFQNFLGSLGTLHEKVSVVSSNFEGYKLHYHIGYAYRQYWGNRKFAMDGIALFGSLIFYLFKLYRSLWQFASINELKNILSAAVIDSIANVFFI